MRRYDMLDEYATLIAPHLGPQARSRPRPAGGMTGGMTGGVARGLRGPMPKRPAPRRWPTPATLLVVGIVLLAAL